MGVAALVLGILGIVLCWIPLIGWLGVLLALAGLVLGAVAIKKSERGLGIAGLVLGIVGVIWGLVVQIPSTYLAVKGYDMVQKNLGEWKQLNDPAVQQQFQQGLQQMIQQAQQGQQGQPAPPQQMQPMQPVQPAQPTQPQQPPPQPVPEPVPQQEPAPQPAQQPEPQPQQ